MTSTKLTILFSGMIASDPHQGGATWAVLQYLLGLKELGHDVYFVEPVANKSLRPTGIAFQNSVNAAYFRQVMTEFSLEESSAFLLEGTRETIGLPYKVLEQVSAKADLLINISGMLTDEALTAIIPVRVYLDLDPAFNQLWHHANGIDMRFDAHNRFVTVGKAIGSEDCTIPTCGIRWANTFQPVVLNDWPTADKIRYDGLTTIANWRGYGSIEHDGVLYGQKAHSFREFIKLPLLDGEKFMPALAIHPEETNDLAALRENGWQILDPAEVAGTPHHYRAFVQGSKAELGIAKSGYVTSDSGWFSDRSVCYLASGRPVIAQDTGFSKFLPTGNGLFAFNSVGEAIESIHAMNADYARHARAARDLAHEFFDSKQVLTRLLSEVEATG
jgi:hypothetical protein